MKRRRFLTQTALFGASTLAAVGAEGWLWKTSAQAAELPRLVVVMLRGAVDGLNVVVPYQDDEYYRARPSIAIAKPGESEGVFDLDGQFGLHPALEALMPQWEAGNLAFVHATGSPDETRSHFEAQYYLENGIPGDKSTDNGWLNRLLGTLPNNSATQGLNISTGGVLPLIFSGQQSVSNLRVDGSGNPQLASDQTRLQEAFDQLYANNDRLGQIYREGREAREILERELSSEEMQASRGAPTPEKFVNTTRSVARLMTGDTGIQVAFLELGGWDTHVNQRGVLNRQLARLGNGLAVLADELGPVYNNTTVVVMSEFGRRIVENGNNGTDHGHGNAMWIMGGGVRGRQVYGSWPGLGTEARYDNRDLAITTDFRDVLSSLLAQQFGLNGAALAQVFPGYQQRDVLTLL
ncbi:MAG: DUF1501 domain-containing protein [Cyanobacteria bacterium J06588_5]